MEVKPGFLEPEEVSLSPVPSIDVTLDNNLSVMHVIHMKMNWQPPTTSLWLLLLLLLLDKIFVTTPDIDNIELAKASGDKNKGDEFRWKKKHENFIATVGKWEMLAATKVKRVGSDKNKVTGTHTTFPSQNL